MHILKIWRITLVLSFFLGGFAQADGKARILALGDSFLVSNTNTQKSIPHVVSQILKRPVKSRAVSGARMIYKLPVSGAMGFNIAQQYRPGPWDWVILNGGGNDLMLGCGCNASARKMNQMISKDGTKGAIPKLIKKIRSARSRVVYVGYLRSPGSNSLIERCRTHGDELDARVTTLAKSDPGVFFVSMADAVPHGDRSFHSVDRIHPSIKGSSAAGKRVAQVIKDNTN